MQIELTFCVLNATIAFRPLSMIEFFAPGGIHRYSKGHRLYHERGGGVMYGLPANWQQAGQIADPNAAQLAK